MRKQIYLDLFGKGKEKFELVDRKVIFIDIRLRGANKQSATIIMSYRVMKDGKTYDFNQERIWNGSFASVRRLVEFVEKGWRKR